jgi:tetratricopeptide (TPR) repeat protein
MGIMQSIYRRIARTALFLPLAFIWLHPARAANEEEIWDRCMQQDKVELQTPEVIIESCRTVLNSMAHYPNIRADAFNNIGVAYMRLKQDEDAIRYFTEALRAIRDQQSTPEFQQLANFSRRNRALAYQRLKKYDLALADYETIAGDEPTPVHFAWRCRARALWAADFASALPDCQKAIEADKRLADAYAGWMIVEYRQGKFADMVSDCKLITDSGIFLADTLYVCGMAEKTAGDAKRGEQMIREANETGLEDLDRFKELGIVPP